MNQGGRKTEQIDLVASQDVLLMGSRLDPPRREKGSFTSLSQCRDEFRATGMRVQAKRKSHACQIKPLVLTHTRRCAKYPKTLLNASNGVEKRRRSTGFITETNNGTDLQVPINLTLNLLNLSEWK